jgi:hypothetical protein
MGKAQENPLRFKSNTLLTGLESERLDCYLPLAVRLRVRFRIKPGKGPVRAAVEVRQLGEQPQGIRPRR